MSARITEAMDILAGMKADLDLLQLAVKAEDPYSELRIRVADLRAATHTLAAVLSTEPGEAEGWQPIATAPNTLDVVLIYDPETKAVGQGHRIDLREHGDPDWMFQATGWRCTPSNWRPLPAAPLPEESSHG
jgi:hypothetical protein